jgi:hypothetical protein
MTCSGCLFFHRNITLHNDLDCLIIAWAEDQITEGNDSETLLILASLGLDNEPERTEVELYLLRYMTKQRIRSATAKNSSIGLDQAIYESTFPVCVHP